MIPFYHEGTNPEEFQSGGQFKSAVSRTHDDDLGVKDFKFDLCLSSGHPFPSVLHIRWTVDSNFLRTVFEVI
jgi:hypothetical protein